MRIIRSLLVGFVAILLVASVFGTVIGTGVSVEDESFSGESVAGEDAEEIEDWHDLDAVRDDLDGDYVLMNDLDEDSDGYDELVDTEEGWEPIGDDDNEFTGTFDGNEYEISNLYIDRPNTYYVGLFGYVGDDGEVRNVSVVDSDVSGDSSVGGLVGYNDYGGTVSNSYATGTVSGDGWNVGGLVGNNPGEIENSYAKGDVSGDRSVGGLVGWNWRDMVSNSYATGNVSGHGLVGGLVGENSGTGTVSNSYAAGNVSGDSSVGGLVGQNSGTVGNSHYNIDSVLINGGHHITIGALFDNQYQDWIEDMKLDIQDYNDTLILSAGHYEINSVDGLRDLLGFADKERYDFRLSSDIDMSDNSGLYIPYLAADFNGDNHTISNLNIDLPFVSHIGIFGFVKGGNVTNLEMVDLNISGDRYVGGLVGYNRGTVSNSHTAGKVSGDFVYVGGLVGRNYWGTVENSYATGNVSGGQNVGGFVGGNDGTVSNSYATGDVSGRYVGGLVGRNYDTVENSYATGDVSGSSSVGGLVGENRDLGTVSNSYASGNVSGKLSRVGGLVGDNEGTVENSYAKGDVSGGSRVGGLIGEDNWGTVSNSYATGDVSGDWYVGGLVGENYDGTVENSYATGEVSGDDNVGGLVGDNRGGTVSNTYATGEVTGELAVGGLVGFDTGTVKNSFWDTETSGTDESDGGTGKTTAEMIKEQTFTDAGWDFEEDWDIIEKETYPFLQWQEEETYPYAVDYSYFKIDIINYDEGVKENEEVTIDYIVTNQGDLDDMQNIEFYVGDELIEIEEDVSLEAGEVHEGEFVWETEEGDAGDHELEVASEDDSEMFTVTVEEEDEEVEDDDGIPGFTSTLLLLGVIFAVAIYRKKDKRT